MNKKLFFVALLATCTIVTGVWYGNKRESHENNIEEKVVTAEVEVAEEKEDVISRYEYTDEELDLLSRVVFAEAGSNWLSDKHQRAVASVVLNRVSDNRFPNSIRGVIYQNGQYACVDNGMINRTPNKRAVENAKYVLENGITIPENIVWQSQAKQGKGVWEYIEGHYFCY